MKRYVIAGASSRCHEMFAKPIVTNFKEQAELAGIFDINRTRAEYMSKDTDPSIPVYTDFDLMMKECAPDTVIVATVDRYHHEYIIKALDYGCDAITEKPMTIDEVTCNAILDRERETGKKVIVTFNLRFVPHITRIKELIDEGAVGKILSVNLEYLLDTTHGADYFRRWHRRKENSGGLLVHKSTHHFDLINWWTGEEPEVVYANGSTRFYGPTREKRSERCLTCSYTGECEFAVRYQDDPYMNEMYFKAEKEDGYFRDRCVFSDEIDIEDSMSVAVKYSKGALLTYSLIAYSPYEAYKISVTGTDGRLEMMAYLSGYGADGDANQILVFNRRGERVTYEIKKEWGMHGGSDERLQRMLFCNDMPDPLGLLAGSYDGAKSIMIGICANKSIKENRPVFVKDLLPGQK